MMRVAGSSWRSRLPLGRTHEAAGRASVAAAPGWTGDENSNGTSKDCRHFWPQRSQARSLCVWGIDRTNSRSYGGALLARLRSSNGDRYAAALLGAPSVGARRSISTPKGSSGGGSSANGGGQKGGSGFENDEGFSESMDGDRWSPPPDAWQPEEQSGTPENSSGVGDSWIDSASEAANAVPDAINVATTTGMSAADLGLWPSHIAMQVIELIHAGAGLPYWQSIAIATVAAKLAVLPAAARLQGMSKRMQIAKPELDVFQAKMNEIKERVEANPEVREAAQQEMTATALEIQQLLKRHSVSYRTMLLSMFAQAPIFYALFISTQTMGGYFPGYATGGFGWVPNLGVPDPTYMLPVAASVTMIVLMEVSMDMPVQRQPGALDMKKIFRGMTFIFIPVAFTMPAGVLVYLCTNGVFGLFQRQLLNQRAVQQALGWPMPEDIAAAQAASARTSEQPSDQEDASEEDLNRWSGRSEHDSSDISRGAADAAERARQAVAEASKVRHEELKREHAEKVKEKDRHQ